nr:MAG TPA: LysM [Caudoviricetes sp.]
MNLRKICAAAVITLSAITMACHAGQAVQERKNPQYKTVSRVVQPGQSLWDICARLNSSEDIRAIIDRARVDNDVDNPGALQPGKVLMIRYKR